MSEKITSLTEEQKAQVPVIRDKWLQNALGGKRLDRDVVTEHIGWLYKFCNLNIPDVLFFHSPLACQYACNIIDTIDEMVEEKEETASTTFFSELQDIIEEDTTPLRDWINEAVEAKLNGKAWPEKPIGKLGDLWNQVGVKMGERELEYYSSAYFGDCSDTGWVAFYDFFDKIVNIRPDDDVYENFCHFRELIWDGVFFMIQLSGICLCSEQPTDLHYEGDGVMHNENGPAISFADGHKLYFWHGVSVKKEWIEDHSSITKEVFMKEDNAEVRRCMQEILGNDFIKILDVELIDEAVDCGNPIRLFKTKEKDEVAGQYIFFLNVVCPSTGREYFHCVRENDNALAAKKSMWGGKGIEIRHGDVGLLNVKREYELPVYEA